MSFDIALSGIQAINDSLDVTSHNIANAGTYGYKSSRANFSTLVAGSQQTGVKVGSMTQNIGLSGGILNTGRSLDASINGKGFFITKNPQSNETQYTRVGIFDASKDGFLIDASGRKVQGYVVDPKTNVNGAMGDLAIPTGSIPAVASDKMTYVGNLSADWQIPATAWGSPVPVDPANPPDTSTFSMSKATILFDSLGGKHTLTQYFARTDDGTGTGPGKPGSVDVHYVLDGVDLATPTTLEFDVAKDGHLTAVAGTADATSLTLALSQQPAFASGAVLSDLTIDYTGTTGFAGDATTAANNATGYASGTFSGVTLGTDGSVIASYSNGQKQTVGRLAVATFPDEGALTQISDTSWTTSVASGEPLVSQAGIGQAGSINVSTLEQSNVDITSELVGLMTSQRNYQANSKVIQTESTMLQSLMQAI